MITQTTEVAESAQLPTRRVLSAGTVIGDSVRNSAGEKLGTIEEIMLDVESGEIAYAVLSFGGFLGIGDKLFALPWSALQLNAPEHEFVLDIEKSRLESAPGFDKDNWPNMADSTWGSDLHSYYEQEPYWERTRAASTPTIVRGAGVSTEPERTRDEQVSAERVNSPDLPEELRRRPIDVTKFPGRDSDSDLKNTWPTS